MPTPKMITEYHFLPPDSAVKCCREPVRRGPERGLALFAGRANRGLSTPDTCWL
jgi:hypothetical protein